MGSRKSSRECTISRNPFLLSANVATLLGAFLRLGTMSSSRSSSSSSGSGAKSGNNSPAAADSKSEGEGLAPPTSVGDGGDLPRPIVVDWAKCMEQVCDDVSFLEEVMNDLLTEALTARDEIAAAVTAANYVAVTKAAHKVKGSASYLYCGHLRLCAMSMQDLGQAISAGTSTPETIEMMNGWFREYCLAYDNLCTEVKDHFNAK